MRLLYKKYKGILFGLIISILNNREEAEDCLQEVFTNVWNKVDQFDSEKGRVYSFLVTIARNKAIDKTRSKTYKISEKENLLSDFSLFSETNDTNPHDDLELKERSVLIRGALKKLSEKEREVLNFSYFKGLSQSEISESLDIPLGTVKYRMRQGMIKLRESLFYLIAGLEGKLKEKKIIIHITVDNYFELPYYC